MSSDFEFGDGIAMTLISVLILFGVGCIGGAIGGCNSRIRTANEYEMEAISHGHAEYIKRADGEIVFQWKEAK